MSSIAIENIDSRLLEQIKQLAIQAGASFRVFPAELPLVQETPTLPPYNQAIADMSEPVETTKPNNLTEALLALPTLDLPDDEDVFARVDNSPMRELDWLE